MIRFELRQNPQKELEEKLYGVDWPYKEKREDMVLLPVHETELTGPRIEVDQSEPTPMFMRKVNNPLPPTAIPPVLVKIQNVHDYFMKHHEEHGWMDLTPFNCILPPFPNMTFSYDHLFMAMPDVPGSMDRLRHVDAMVEAADQELMRKVKTKHVSFSGPGSQLKQIQDGEEVQLTEILDDVKPAGVLRVQLGFDGEILPGSMFVMHDETGQVIKWRDVAHIFIRTPSEREKLGVMGVEHEVIQGAFQRHTAITLAAIQFMNCRNVEIIDNAPTRQQRRHAERDGKRAPVSYKTLVIHPIGKRRLQTGAAIATGEERALHICRGHFKDYRQGPGLGKYHRHGVWWWSPCVKGSAEHGRVVKDYEVQPE